MKRNAVHVAAVRTQVHLVVPHLIAVNIGVNVPADAVVFVQVYSAEIIPFPEGCKYGSGLKQRASIVQSGLAIIKAQQQCEIISGNDLGNAFAPGSKIFCHFPVVPFGQIIFYTFPIISRPISHYNSNQSKNQSNCVNNHVGNVKSAAQPGSTFHIIAYFTGAELLSVTS